MELDKKRAPGRWGEPLFAWICAFAVCAAPFRASADGADAIRRLEAAGISPASARDLVDRWEHRGDERPPEELAAVVEEAVAGGAPADLMAAKASEGFAKGIPAPRLMGALRDWGDQLATASAMARQLREQLPSEGVSEHETILRVAVLRRAHPNEAWLGRLQDKARTQGVDLRGFLRFAEAVTQLSTRLGVPPQVAENVGTVLMDARVAPDDVGKALRAIEVQKAFMPASEAARDVVEQMRGGVTVDDVLRGAQEKARSAQEAGRSAAEDRGSASGKGEEGAQGREDEAQTPETEREDQEKGGSESRSDDRGPDEDGPKKGPPEDREEKGPEGKKDNGPPDEPPGRAGK